MRLSIIMLTAIVSLRRTMARSALASLGIIVGVASVVAMISIGSGAKARLEDALSRPESRLLILSALQIEHRGPSLRTVSLLDGGLTVEDYLSLRKGIGNVAGISPVIAIPEVDASANGRDRATALLGVDVGAFELRVRRLLDGSRFGTSDVERAESVVVITRDVEDALFPDTRAMGRLIRVNGVPFLVVGVVGSESFVATEGGVVAQDFSVFIPYTSLILRLQSNSTLSIKVQATLPSDLGRLRKEVGDLMEERRGRRNSEFRIYSSADAIMAYEEGSQTLARLLAATGGISLIVGGIGIMNIMLVAVSERTREIGLRRAVGTRTRDVLLQFLFESVLLSFAGGVIGVPVGVSLSWLITASNGWPTDITLTSVLIACVFSILIGAFFGFYPALRASRLDPIAALRTD